MNVDGTELEQLTDGTWNDFAEYMTSDKYIRMNSLQALVYPAIARISNRTVERIRSSSR